jgi:hypothetical protein
MGESDASLFKRYQYACMVCQTDAATGEYQRSEMIGLHLSHTVIRD